jgi:hypothetical protein
VEVLRRYEFATTTMLREIHGHTASIIDRARTWV